MRQQYVDMSQLNQRWHNALPLTGLGHITGARETGGIFGPNILRAAGVPEYALGSYYDGGFDSAIASANSFAAQTRSSVAGVRQAKDTASAIVLFRQAVSQCQTAQGWLSKAQDQLSSTQWPDTAGAAVDMGVAQATLQKTVQSVQSACNSIDGAGAYIDTLPKPPLPAEFTTAINDAVAAGTMASSIAKTSIAAKVKKDAYSLAQQAYSYCEKGSQHLADAMAIYNAIDWNAAVFDEQDAIDKGNYAAGIVTQGCADVQAAFGHVNSIPGGEIPDQPAPVIHTCPSGKVWDAVSAACVPAFSSTQCPEGQVLDAKYQACVWAPGHGPTAEANIWLGLGIASLIGLGAWYLTKKKGR